MIAAELLSAESLELGWAIYAPLLLLAAWRAPWVELVSDTRRQHLVFGTMLGLFLLWLVRRDFESGLSFHFIGMTAVTLLLDWPLAIVVGLVAQLGLCLLGRQDWLAIGVNGVLLVAIPALIAELAALFVEKRQPRNLFVYIFCCGFFPAALTAVVVLLLGLGVVWIDGLFAREGLRELLSKSDEADRAMRLRALLSAIVELNRAERDAGDLASELQFLAENLDDQRDYAFMRP